MSQLPDTTTKEGQRKASDLMCKACGWRVAEIDTTGPTMRECWTFVPGEAEEVYRVLLFAESRHSGFPNLYAPANMALAWRVLNWFYKLAREEQEQNPQSTTDKWWGWHAWQLEMMQAGIPVEEMPPAEAQRAWLDKILSLAIRAGMVQE